MVLAQAEARVSRAADESVRDAFVARFALPTVVSAAMPVVEAQELLGRLEYMRARRPHVKECVLVMHVQNGLGNRLRALAGGVALARVTGRVPLIVWERDAHLSAGFRDLFQHPAAAKLNL